MIGVPSARRLRLTDRQKLNWLRLIRSENVGPATFRDLINRFGSAEEALAALPDLAARGGGSSRIRICARSDAEAELQAVARHGAELIAIGEPNYPETLRHMDMPPPLLLVKGRLDVLERPAVSVVGARNASLSGLKIARSLAGGLGEAGFTVVSGLARGIDAAAHQASLGTGTVAVLAGGLDKPYPPENLDLLASIETQGVVLTEMPMGWEPRARDFPRRNRLIAGLGLGLVVVEAAQRSGSLITARLANEIGRLVFAVPGSPLDPRSAGTNGLLKDGAILTTDTSDVLSQLSPVVGRSGPAGRLAEPDADLSSVAEPAEEDRSVVVGLLSPTPVSIDDLIRHSQLPAAQVHLALLELDLAGRLERHSGGAVSLLAATHA